ncbi:hypothetical protein D3C86_1984320 [compost metagenome]
MSSSPTIVRTMVFPVNSPARLARSARSSASAARSSCVVQETFPSRGATKAPVSKARAFIDTALAA